MYFSDVNGGSGSPSKILLILAMPCSMTSHPSPKRIVFLLGIALRTEAAQRKAGTEAKKNLARDREQRKEEEWCIDEVLSGEGREVAVFR